MASFPADASCSTILRRRGERMNAKLVTKKEIAARYSVHPKTVEKWADAGIIPVVKINRRCVRFDLNKCDLAMERRTRISH
jgi:hypothetical protein